VLRVIGGQRVAPCEPLQSRAVVEPFRKHRAFAIASASSGIALVLMIAAFAIVGRRGVDLFGKRWWTIQGFLAWASSLWVLGIATVLVFREKKRRRFYPLVVIAWWLAVETFAAPFLVRSIDLWHYGIMQDIDHIPRIVGGEYNSDSLRATPEPSAFTPRSMNIVFLGDSFTLGNGLSDGREAFPILARDALRAAHPDADVEVANFGWTSSSPLLSYRRLVDIGDKYRPKIVLMCVDMTDFDDDIRYQAMFDRRGLYALYDRIPITLHYFRKWAPDLYARVVSWSTRGTPTQAFFITEAPLEETRPWFQPLVDNVEKIHAWCRARGADFVLVIMPRAYQYTDRESPDNWERHQYTTLGPYCKEPFRYFDELRPKVDYPIVSLFDDFASATEFPLCFPNDPHWNAAGHKVAARAFVRILDPLIARRIAR
jgi:lysophospholipase L1-like esterase